MTNWVLISIEFVGLGHIEPGLGGLHPVPVSTTSPAQLPLTINSGMAAITRAMQRPESGLEVRDRMWLKIKISSAFIGSEVVDWLYSNVDGFEVSPTISNLLPIGATRKVLKRNVLLLENPKTSLYIRPTLT